MLCAECPRCRRRSIIGNTDKPTLPDAATAGEPRLRCDLCGCRDVRVLRFNSPIEAVRFMNAKG